MRIKVGRDSENLVLISKSGCLQSSGVTATFWGQFDYPSLGKLGKNQTCFPKMGAMVSLAGGQRIVNISHSACWSSNKRKYFSHVHITARQSPGVLKVAIKKQ